MSQNQSELLTDIRAFCEGTGMSVTTFGRKAISDPHLVRGLSNGRRMWPENEARVRRFMAEYQPSDAPTGRAA